MFWHSTKEPRYFSAVDEIREGYAPASLERFKTPLVPRTSARGMPGETRDEFQPSAGASPLGKLPGSVWTIATEPLRVPDHLGIDHFAAFPTEWPRRIIQGWSPREVCTVCGEGRRPVTDNTEKYLHRPGGASRLGTNYSAAGGPDRARHDVGNERTVHRITGYACACPDTTAPTTPGIVLDPFGGTGTTALVADVLGRDAISVDLSADYCRLAQWRTTDPGQRAKAARVAPAEAPLPGQQSLFEGIA